MDVLGQFSIRMRSSGLLVFLVILGGCSGNQGGISAGLNSTSAVGGDAVTGRITSGPSDPTMGGSRSTVGTMVTDSTTTVTGTVNRIPASPPTGVVSSVVTSIALLGEPPATAIVGRKYSFQPKVSGSGAAVTFGISGQPAWITFNRVTGEMIGTPLVKDEGTTGHIRITANTAGSVASTMPFTIHVDAADPSSTATGSAALSWTIPTENADGTPVTNLAGYRIYYGTDSTELTKTVDVAGATSSTHVLRGLTPGQYYFAVVAYNSEGLDSGYSTITDTKL